MANTEITKPDAEKVVEQYLSQFKGEPDATRLLLNLLADNLTDLDQLMNYIIKQEFQTAMEKSEAEKTAIVAKIAGSYGVSEKYIESVIGE